MSAIGAIVSLLQTFVYIIVMGSILWSLMCLISGVLFLAVFLLNKYDKANQARILYFCFTSIFVLVFGVMLGDGNGMHFYYIPLLCVLFVLYSFQEDKKVVYRLASFIFLTILLLVTLEGRYDGIDVDPSFMRQIYLSNFFTSLIITLLAVYNVVSINMRVEKRMSIAETNLKAVFNSTQETLYIISTDYTIIEFNRAAAQQVKMYNGMILKIGAKVFQYVADPVEFRILLDRCIRGELINYVKEVKAVDGATLFYEIKMTPIRNAHNEVIGVSSAGLNVTAKMLADLKLKSSERLWSTIVNEIPSAIVLTKADTKEILFCNADALKIFQVDSEEEFKSVKGEVFHKKVPDAIFFSAIEDSLQTRGIWKSEVEYVGKKGREFWGELIIKRILIDDQIYDLVKVRDITKKVKEKADLLAFVEMKKRDIANQQKQKNLSLIIHGQDKERQRFSKELHDGIGQMLTAVRLQVAALDLDNEEAFKSQKQKINKTIDSTISEVKRISSNLMPSAIEDFGLLGALEHLTNLVPPSIAVVFTHDEFFDTYKLSQKEQFATYRIAQEAVNNAVKYSAATRITVSLTKHSDSELLLQINDDGKGFKQDKLLAFYKNHTIGSGLNNMKERAELIQARLLINSILGEGTSINLFIPLHIKSE